MKLIQSLLQLACAWGLWGCSHHVPIYDQQGKPLEDAITQSEQPIINGIPQRIMLRGAHRDLPVLLVVHGGLGTPYSAISHRFQTQWEQAFIVAHWEQPGSGKLYAQTPPEHLSTEQLIKDTIAVAAHLKQRFGQRPIYIMGHSWGSYLALQAVHRAPELFKVYVGVGATLSILKADLASHQWVLAQAQARDDQKALAQMREIGPPPYLDIARAYDVKYPLIAKYGGFLMDQTSMSYMPKAVLSSPDYSWWDALLYVRGMRYYSQHLLRNENEGVWQLSAHHIQTLSVPVYFINGSNDQVTPAALLQDYLQQLQAPRKKYLEIAGAAHFPFIDQTGKFNQLLMQIREENEDKPTPPSQTP